METLSKNHLIGFVENSETAPDVWSGSVTAPTSMNLCGYDANKSIIDPAVNVSEINVTQSKGLVKEQRRTYVDATSGMPTMNFEGTATLDRLYEHFAAALQLVKETVTATPYQKTFIPLWTSYNTNFREVKRLIDYTDGDIDIKSNQLFTIFDAPNYVDGSADYKFNIIKNALLDSFSFKVNANASGEARLAKVSGTWKGIEHTTVNLDSSTVTYNEPTYSFLNSANKFALNLTCNGVTYTDVCCRLFELNINNNVMSDCKTIGGKANNLKASNPEYKVTIHVPYTRSETANQNLETLLTDYKAGHEISFSYSTGTTNNLGYLSIEGQGTITANPTAFEGDYDALNLQIDLRKKNATDTISDTVYGFAVAPVKVILADGRNI